MVYPVRLSVAVMVMVNGYPKTLPQPEGPVNVPVEVLKVTPLGSVPDSE